MKSQLLTSLILALPATSAFAADSPGFPHGTYGAQGAPYTVSFEDKGEFHVTKEGTLEVSGTYSVKADELKLTDSAGPWACTAPGEQSGTYKWKFEKGVLTLVKVADKCADRVNSLVSLEWKQT
ncbi:MAG: hypothetical protein JSS29_08560 [Proteobacteria bacterium]|nr:hypothetical protein [Pseudomonadota bacterium]